MIQWAYIPSDPGVLSPNYPLACLQGARTSQLHWLWAFLDGHFSVKAPRILKVSVSSSSMSSYLYVRASRHFLAGGTASAGLWLARFWYSSLPHLNCPLNRLLNCPLKCPLNCPLNPSRFHSLVQLCSPLWCCYDYVPLFPKSEWRTRWWKDVK